MEAEVFEPKRFASGPNHYSAEPGLAEPWSL